MKLSIYLALGFILCQLKHTTVLQLLKKIYLIMFCFFIFQTMFQHKAHDVAKRPRTEDIHINEELYFKSMLLSRPILKGLNQRGYKKPSPIQKQAFPLVRCGMGKWRESTSQFSFLFVLLIEIWSELSIKTS